MAPPLRLVLYDGTDGLLSLSWWAGVRLYRGLQRIEAWRGVASWGEGLEWLASHGGSQQISEIQFWGHGHSGMAMVAGEALDASVLSAEHAQRASLAAIRRRMVPVTGLWWFRTCSTFGGVSGAHFAREWSRFFGTRVAGHTYDIGPWQSGLHSLSPNAEPAWPVEEGVGQDSSWAAPNTITCFHGQIPPGY